MKKFIITIDTEGDNQWAWRPGDRIRTENTKFLQRFQNLANQYGFRPVWLSNYEMLNDPTYVDFAGRVEADKTGELGMHLHAWSTPPDYPLAKAAGGGAPYLIEYPDAVMEEKISAMTSLIRERTGIQPVSHRAGRWAMDQRYYDLLIRYGYKLDCSVTPHIDWSKSPGRSVGSAGSDYSHTAESPYLIENSKGKILEVPVTIRRSHRLFQPVNMTLRKLGGAVYRAFKGEYLWLRPSGKNLSQMLFLLNSIVQSSADYVMFMMHSSEMMPGGSPTFQTIDSIERMYADTEVVFQEASKQFEGITLRDYALQRKEQMINE